MSEKQSVPPAQSGALVPVRPAVRLVFTPRVDILHNENELVLLADVPGVGPDDIDVRFENGELTIDGKCAPRAFGTRPLGEEYEVGDYHRVFTLSNHIDGDRITAQLTQGVLTVRLPKREAVKPKRVPVQGA
jgi:HSP20 family protein